MAFQVSVDLIQWPQSKWYLSELLSLKWHLHFHEAFNSCSFSMSWFSTLFSNLLLSSSVRKGCTGRNQRLNTSLSTWNMGPTRGIKKQPCLPKSQKVPGSSHTQDTNQPKPLSCQALNPCVLCILVPSSVLLASPWLGPTLCLLFFSLYIFPRQSWAPHAQYVKDSLISLYMNSSIYFGYVLHVQLVLTVEDAEMSNRLLVNNSLSIILTCASHYLWG